MESQEKNKFSLISLNDEYYLLGDCNMEEPFDSRIDYGDVFYKDDLKAIFCAESFPPSKVSRPVIASTKNLEGIPVLDRKHVENLLGIDYSETLFWKLYGREFEDNEVTHLEKGAFKTGFWQHALANADKQFTLNDIKELMQWSAKSSWAYYTDSSKTQEDVFNQIDNKINSFVKAKQKTEWIAEIEMIKFEVDMGLGEECVEHSEMPRIVDNKINILKLI